MESITQLFSQKSIDEVVEFEKKTRHDIELKKEELRQMVGERYRDLIEAADTINEMKVCSTNVKASVKDLQQFCVSKSICKSKPMSLVKKQSSSKVMSRYMEIAAQAKVLMEMPEKIWSHVEAGQMIIAAVLYLQSLEVLKNLSLDGATSYSAVLLWFPMLGQQAQAVGNLRNAILKESRIHIRDYLLHTERLAEALCAIAILERSSLTEILQVLLKARLSLLQDLFSDAEGFSKDGVKNLGAKEKICTSVTIVKQTILQIYDLFCNADGGLMTTMLSNYNENCDRQAFQHLPQNETSTLWLKHLPKDVADFFKFQSENLEIAVDLIRSLCLEWFAKCETELNSGIQDSLKFTAAAKDLANIRNDLMEILGYDSNKVETTTGFDDWIEPVSSEPNQPTNDSWSKACQAIFSREILLWKDLLSKLFLEKINMLVDDTFTKLFEASKSIFSLTSETLVNMKTMSSHIWQEHEGDIVSDMAWNQWQTRKQKNLSAQGGLSLKAATVTPGIRRACDGVNEKMGQLLADLNFCVPSLLEQEQKNSSFPQSSFDEAELKTVVDHLRCSCYKFLRNLISHICELESALKKSESPETKSLDNILHLSLLCRNFFDLCHSFKQCCCQKEPPSALKRQFSAGAGSKVRLERSKSVDSAWTEMVNSMHQRSHSLMSVWCRAVLADALKPYRESLLASAFNKNLFNSMATWDSLTVEEENESGEKVTSQIKVPAAATSYTMQFLYFLCSELNRVGGHSASRYTLRYLSQCSLENVFKIFSDARRAFSVGDANLHGQSRTSGTSATPSQIWAVQCLFDLRYLHSLLYQPSLSVDEEEKLDSTEEEEDSSFYTFTELIDWLEGYVDPFDLDVFSPHISRNIQRHVARTCVMLGLLCSPEKLSTSSQKFVAATKDSHNVMPLSPDCGRFSYLPVSGRAASKRLSQGIDRTLTRQLPLASALRDLTRDSVGANEKQSARLTSSLYSKLGALSSSWLSSSPHADD